MFTAIQSRKNPAVLAAKRLQQSKFRRQDSLLLLEGEHLLQEAIGATASIVSIFATLGWLSANEKILSILSKSASIYQVDETILSAISTTDTPPEVVGTAQWDRSKKNTGDCAIDLGLAVERIQSPGNLGTLIRSVAATGGQGIWQSLDSVDATSPKVLRSSAGHWFRNPPQATDLSRLVDRQKELGTQVLGADMQGRSMWECDLTKPTLFVLGNEGAGLSDAISQSVDGMISVPMSSEVESLNVAMTGCLLLYEALRQRQ